MGGFFKFLGGLLLLLIAAAIGVVAWNLFAKPFSLRILADRQAIAFVLRQPEILTQIGAIDGTFLDQHSGKLTEVSVARRDEDLAIAGRFLAELDGYRDPDTYEGQDALTYRVLREYYLTAQALAPFDWTSSAGYLYAVDQMWAPPTGLAVFMQTAHPLKNAKTARNYVARLDAIALKLDQVGAEVERQAAAGVILPAFLFDKTLKGMRDFVEPASEDNVLYTHFAEKLPDVPGLDDAERAALLAAAQSAIETGVRPAFRRLIDRLEALRPRATNDAGAWKLPNGDAYYAAMVRQNTTTDYSPEYIHDLGLREVARIEAEMDAILRAEGLVEGSVGVRVRQVSQRPDQLFEDSDAGREAILQGYRDILAEIERDLVPQTFSRTPKAPVEIRRMQPFEEVGAAGAYYSGPALDGSRPGIFFANLGDVSATPRLSMKTLVVHEASPGHHFQISIAQELEGLPLLRTIGNFTAYAEGWALYAERLAWEYGLYEGDPTGDLGRLRDEMFRAVRLVVDTGIHAKRWTREEAVAFMIDKTGMADGEVENEIDRYITGPGQALAYKVGQLAILDLRERARARLGDRFDLKAFHAVVLENGALPLTVLDQVVEDWIVATEAGAATP